MPNFRQKFFSQQAKRVLLLERIDIVVGEGKNLGSTFFY
jgi:hypothetical protein